MKPMLYWAGHYWMNGEFHFNLNAKKLLNLVSN